MGPSSSSSSSSSPSSPSSSSPSSSPQENVDSRCLSFRRDCGRHKNNNIINNNNSNNNNNNKNNEDNNIHRRNITTALSLKRPLTPASIPAPFVRLPPLRR